VPTAKAQSNGNKLAPEGDSSQALRNRQDHHETRLGDDAIDDAGVAEAVAPEAAEGVEEGGAADRVVVDEREGLGDGELLVVVEHLPRPLDRFRQPEAIFSRPHTRQLLGQEDLVAPDFLFGGLDLGAQCGVVRDLQRLLESDVFVV